MSRWKRQMSVDDRVTQQIALDSFKNIANLKFETPPSSNADQPGLDELLSALKQKGAAVELSTIARELSELDPAILAQVIKHAQSRKLIRLFKRDNISFIQLGR